MNPDPDHRNLLDDLCAEDDAFLAHEAKLKAFAAGRARRKRVARVVLPSALALAALAVTLTGLFKLEPAAGAGPQPVVAQARPAERPTARNAAKIEEPLTDEQLIAAFPPNSCMLIELDGKPVLVFRDAELQRRYFQ